MRRNCSRKFLRIILMSTCYKEHDNSTSIHLLPNAHSAFFCNTYSLLYPLLTFPGIKVKG